MQVFATMSERMALSEVGEHARRVEAMGYDGLLVPEAVHDGFLTSMAVLAATGTLRVTTSVLVVFPRSPMTTAQAAWDLQACSRPANPSATRANTTASIVFSPSSIRVPWKPRRRPSSSGRSGRT